MANINVRIDEKIEIALKKEAIALGVSVSDLVRERISGEMKRQQINELTLENRIEQLEEQQKKLAYMLNFNSKFLYHFAAICAGDDEAAAKAWETARKELEERE